MGAGCDLELDGPRGGRDDAGRAVSRPEAADGPLAGRDGRQWLGGQPGRGSGANGPDEEEGRVLHGAGRTF